MQNSLPTTCIWMWHNPYECDMFLRTWHDAYEFDMTHTNVTWRIWMWHDAHECDMTHMKVTWPVTVSLPYIESKIRIKAFHILTSWQMSHDTYACDMTYQGWVMTHVNVISRIINGSWHTRMSNASCMSHYTHKCDMVHMSVCGKDKSNDLDHFAK